MTLHENIVRIHEIMGIDKPKMVYDYEEGRNTVESRLPFDIDKLVDVGAVFVTPSIDGDPESETYKEWTNEPFSHLITLYNIHHADQDSWIHKAVTKKAPTNDWKDNLGKKLYDGKYNQILWSLDKLGINPKDILVDETNSLKQETNENELTEKCWPGYEKKGMKTIFGKRYPNCVKKKKSVSEDKKETDAKWIKCKNCRGLFTQTIYKGKKSLPICPTCGTHN
jgi:hypothetical protein